MKNYKTHSVKVRDIGIGGDNPIRIQSMTDTNTSDVDATIEQIIALAAAGSELVRITVDNIESAKAVPLIRHKLIDTGYNIPLVGCFHYNGHTLLSEVPDCAKALDKYRINPGNVGFGIKKDQNFEQIIKIAIEHNKPVRIGANWGSLDQDILAQMMDEAAKYDLNNDDIMVKAMVQSALTSAARAVEIGLNEDMIILSAKVSRVDLLKRIYIELANQSNYALHLGLTEAGMGIPGIVSTTAALTAILELGIGNTIRASITPAPNEVRINEVLVCKEVLQSLGFRIFSPTITSCPGCGRTKSNDFKQLTMDTNNFMQSLIGQYPGIETLKIAVMGCIVNGPGESKHANIGISLPGKGEEDVAVVFIDGHKTHTLRGQIFPKFKEIIIQYLENRFINSN
jgi:(E)-4-hydroxy-3-methylbut-2-enyl-diphosphate synthase